MIMFFVTAFDAQVWIVRGSHRAIGSIHTHTVCQRRAGRAVALVIVVGARRGCASSRFGGARVFAAVCDSVCVVAAARSHALFGIVSLLARA